MSLLNRLCKPQPTWEDFILVKERQKELLTIIEGYLAGTVSGEVASQARQEIDVLALLVRKVVDRETKSKLKVVK